MKIAFLSESSADESGIRILVDAVRNEISEPSGNLPLRSRGWPSVERVLPVVLKHLHYQTDVDALVVVVDSDDSPIHNDAHESGEPQPDCRLCNMRTIVRVESAKLHPVIDRRPLKTAIGLAVPALEAWYRCRLDPHVNEAAWARRMKSGERLTYTRRSLKEAVYGTTRPTIEIANRAAIASAQYLVEDISQIESLFPGGFGALVRDIQNW